MVIRTMDELSIPYEERSLLADYGGFGSSILVRSNNDEDKAESSSGTFVLAVPLDAKFAVDTAIALTRKIENRNILVAFLGDEHNELSDGGTLSHKGLRDLLSLTNMPENWIICYLDADKDPAGISIRHGSRGYVAPLDLIRPLPLLFELNRVPWEFEIRYNEIYKSGLVEGPQALSLTWEAEINSFALSGIKNEESATDINSVTETVSMDVLSDLLLDYSEKLVFPVLKADRHYSIITLPGKNVFFMSEGATVILLLVLAGIFICLFFMYSLKYNAVVIFHFRLFFKYIWIFFILLPLLVISIKISGFLYSLLFAAFAPNNPSAETVNYSGVILVVILAALIFFLPSPVLGLFKFPRRAKFYGFAAIFFTAIGVFSAAFLDFSYVLVFLWVFIFVFLASWLHNPFIIFLCGMFAPIFALGAISNIFETNSPEIMELFISRDWNTPDKWLAALQIALLSLPLFLLAKRGTILIRAAARYGLELKPNRKIRLLVVPIMIIAVLGIMIIHISLLPSHSQKIERRFIVEDNKSEKQLESILDLSLNDIIFQDSRIITIHLDAVGTPLRFDVSLESEYEEDFMQIYSSPVPFERMAEGRRIVFHMGEYAPNPLEMEIVVPLKFEALLKCAAVYNNYDPDVDSGERPDTNDYVFVVSKTAKLTATETRP